jgi:hypothetical protein
MTYVEFPFDRILSLHVKKADEPPGGGGEPVLGECLSGTFYVLGAPQFIYVTLGGKSYPRYEGTYLDVAVCCPPYPNGGDWSTTPPTFPTNYQDSLFIPGNGARAVTLTYVAKNSGGNQVAEGSATQAFVTIKSGPDMSRPPVATGGYPGSVSVTIPPVVRAPGDPENLMGTSVAFQIVGGGGGTPPPGWPFYGSPPLLGRAAEPRDVTPNYEYWDEIRVQHDCPPPHLRRASGPIMPLPGFMRPRCGELG